MKHEFVNYNQALKLKELGFDESCVGFYQLEYGEIRPCMVDDDEQYRLTGWRTCKNSEIPKQYTSAPTFSQAFRWFRDTHNMFHEIQIDRTTEPKFCYAVFHYEHYGNYEEIRIGDWSLYRTYEDAELACLENFLEVVETKSEQDDKGNE
jgi:hypothetical protein